MPPVKLRGRALDSRFGTKAEASERDLNRSAFRGVRESVGG